MKENMLIHLRYETLHLSYRGPPLVDLYKGQDYVTGFVF